MSAELEVSAAYVAIHQEVTGLLDPVIEKYLSKGLPTSLLNGARLLYRATDGEDAESLTHTTATIRQRNGRGFQLSHKKLGYGGYPLRHQPNVNLWHPDDWVGTAYDVEIASKIVEILRSPETKFQGLLLSAPAA